MKKLSGSERRSQRVRSRIRLRAKDRQRLSVFRSNKHIGAQVINNDGSRVLVAVSTVEKDVLKQVGDKGSNTAAAEVVGKLVAERALKAGVKEVVFDRGSYIYHGRVKALAEAARAAGLSF